MLAQTVWRVARLTLGVTFLGLGVVGLFLPVLQGIVFIVLGLTLLSRDSSRARRWLAWIKQRTGWSETRAGEECGRSE